MLVELSETAKIRDGMFALLASIMELDIVVVQISGASMVLVWQGVSEGGLLGPLAFPSFMDTLTRDLLAKGCGVGLGVSMPEAWSTHAWVGSGTPDLQVATGIAQAIRSNAQLPSVQSLQESPDLEASALKALDITSTTTLPNILHADDPVLLASSYGEACRILVVMQNWAFRMKTSPHVGPGKAIVMAGGPEQCSTNAAKLPPLVVRLVGRPPAALGFAINHKGLSLMWNASLELSKAMHAVAGCAGAKLAVLVGLAVANVVPLCFVGKLFEAIAEGTMRFGRWLYVTADNAEEFLNTLYQKWARALLGALPWRSWPLLFSELGWTYSGAGRAIVDIAMRRCNLYRLDAGDLYRSVFIDAHGTACSWASKSKALLDKWGVVDWIDWEGPSTNRSQYKDHALAVVGRRCRDDWLQATRSTTGPVDYLRLRPTMSSDLVDAQAQGWPWHSLLLQRSLCRLRANLLSLTHLEGRVSRARRQRCILCSQSVLSPTFHVLCSCEHLAEVRSLFWSSAGVARPESVALEAEAMLSCGPSSPAYGAMLAFAGCLDKNARHFWGGES